MVSVKEIDAILPQTQCGECGYKGCLPYAEALAQRQAPIDRCPPGGVSTIKALGELLTIDPTPFLSTALSNTKISALANIREEECIGCTKCIQACPVDAIIGSAKKLHTVFSHECTGCGLCVDPCPVDCIEMIRQEKNSYDKSLARNRFNAKKVRLLQEDQQKQQLYREKRQLAAKNGEQEAIATKQNYILEALARVQAKKNK